VTASEVIDAARAAKIAIRVDGDDLVLEAEVAPAPSLIELIHQHKAAIVQELLWSAAKVQTAPPENGDSAEVFQFAPPDDPANDDEALQERVAIMMESNRWDEATALREARWQADRERCWRTFLGNARRILDAPTPQREPLLARYQLEATYRYENAAGADMAASMRNWVSAR